KSKREPILPLRIFKAPNLTQGNVVMGLMAASWIPLWFFLNLYLQQILNLNAFKSGMALLPMTILIMVLMVGVTGKLVAKHGYKKIMIAGLVSLAVSLVLFSIAPTDGSYLIHVLPASLLGALGMSLAYIPTTMASMSGAKPEETGLASGIVNTSYQVGSALGLALVAVVASAVTATSMESGVDSVTSLNSGFSAAFIGAAVIAVVNVFIATFKIK
ncbi:MAG TPA: MFS transporter, partial [Flavipsychrobacter sp.]